MPMADLIPDGYITCREAFQTYVTIIHDAKFMSLVGPKYDPQDGEQLKAALAWKDNWNGRCDEFEKLFLAFFAKGELEALVRVPPSNENIRILPDDWRLASTWPDCPFRTDRILAFNDSPLAKFDKRIPFLSKAEFTVWLKGELRKHLLNELKYGRIELEIAKARARALGIELERRPDPSMFDPMSESDWTLPMVVAWIAFKDIEKVRGQMNSWRAVTEDLVERTQTGLHSPDLKVWKVRPVQNAMLRLMAFEEAIQWDSGGNLAGNQEMEKLIEGAIKQLWNQLGSGGLVARGKLPYRPRQEIPKHYWQDLQRNNQDFIEDYVSRSVQGENWLDSEEKWFDVTVPREDVLEVWQAQLSRIAIWDFAERKLSGDPAKIGQLVTDIYASIWKGDIGTAGLSLLQDNGSKPGPDLFENLTRFDLAEAALGQAQLNRIGEQKAYEILTSWNMEDYRKINYHYAYQFVRGKSVESESTSDNQESQYKRGLYADEAELEQWYISWPPKIEVKIDNQLEKQSGAQYEAMTLPTLVVSPAISKVDLERAYKTRVDEWPPDKTAPTVSDDQKFLKGLKPNITRERCREIRKDHAPDSWKRAGKKSAP